MVRLDYTKKGMLRLVDDKYKKGELKNISYLLNFYRYKRGHNYGYGYSYGYGYGVYGNAYHEKDNQTWFQKIKNIFKRFK